eukprot:2016708-Alexandrium_andersonii.AAC.1
MIGERQHTDAGCGVEGFARSCATHAWPAATGPGGVAVSFAEFGPVALHMNDDRPHLQRRTSEPRADRIRRCPGAAIVPLCGKDTPSKALAAPPKDPHHRPPGIPGSTAALAGYLLPDQSDEVPAPRSHGNAPQPYD